MRHLLCSTLFILVSFALLRGDLWAEEKPSPADGVSSAAVTDKQDGASKKHSPRKSSRHRIAAEGESGKRLEESYKQQKEDAGISYSRWKMKLPFWPRKLVIMLELMLVIAIGIFFGQALELVGLIRPISIITWPLLWLGALPWVAAPALIMSFQSGAVANTMLVGYRDEGQLNSRELYTAVIVVSCFSLFAHLPTFLVPLGMAFGWEATGALFGVRFLAILVEIVAVLLVSRFVIARFWNARNEGNWREVVATSDGGGGEKKKFSSDADSAGLAPGQEKKERPSLFSLEFWHQVWRRSQRTLRRLLVYVIPTALIMSGLEYWGFFEWLQEVAPGLFSLSFLPAQAPAVIAAQAVNLYNGAMVAANFMDAGEITSHQAVIIILFGSLLTAPIRTLKHALPTYVAVLGARPGLVMAVLAQILRCLFLAFFVIILMLIWS